MISIYNENHAFIPVSKLFFFNPCKNLSVPSFKKTFNEGCQEILLDNVQWDVPYLHVCQCLLTTMIVQSSDLPYCPSGWATSCVALRLDFYPSSVVTSRKLFNAFQLVTSITSNHPVRCSAASSPAQSSLFPGDLGPSLQVSSWWSAVVIQSWLVICFLSF